ncbi:MAG: AraC family transcriptional regulator [Lachnospiraceae bacterium]|nr:AraC family transcriptional regulator [Lachnospiraceae bacterium]
MKKYDVKQLPDFGKNEKAIYCERESGTVHFPFKEELELCTAIKNGDREKLEKQFEQTLRGEMVVGNLSSNRINSVKYWAVTTVANAVHYAILGGVDETDAYNFSDECIRKIDSFKEYDECIDYLMKRALELADMVKSRGNNAAFSEPVKKCLHYIHLHLHESIPLNVLAEETGLSRPYLASLFKKETGSSIHEYILDEKMKEATALLDEGKSCKEVSYVLGICNQSHFGKIFRAKYGMTPEDYKNRK